MADRVSKVNYCYLVVPSRVGKGAAVLAALKDAGVNMFGYSGFPVSGGKAQLDIVTESVTPVRKLAKLHGWRLSKNKKGFWIHGPDKIGAVHRHVQRLADHGINVTAASAVCAGGNRYGMLLWVKEKDYARASRALRAK